MRHATFILIILIAESLRAQNPFAPLGRQAHVLSLSQGAYPEVFQNDTLRTICGMVYNRVTNQIIGFTAVDPLVSESGMKPELVSRWLSLDPLAAKYADISPYAFVGNSPLAFLDPDGRKIVFAPGTSESYKQKFVAVVKLMNERKISGGLARLEASETTYRINEGYLGAQFNAFHSQGPQLTIDLDMVVITSTGHVLSTPTILAHEVDHAVHFDENPAEYNTMQTTPDPEYKVVEERRTIEGTEQKAAKAMGDIKEGEVTRSDHKGVAVRKDGEQYKRLDDTIRKTVEKLNAPESKTDESVPHE